MGHGNTRQRNGARQPRIYDIQDLRRVGLEMVIVIHRRQPGSEEAPDRVEVSRVEGTQVDRQRAWVSLEDPRFAEAVASLPIPSGPVQLTLPEEEGGPIRAEVLPNTLVAPGLPMEDLYFLALMHARKVRRRYEQVTGESLDSITKEIGATALIGFFRDNLPFMTPEDAARLLSYEEMVRSGTEKPMVEVEADRERRTRETEAQEAEGE